MTSLLSYKKISNPQINVCVFLEVSKQPLVWLTKSENQLFIDFGLFSSVRLASAWCLILFGD